MNLCQLRGFSNNGSCKILCWCFSSPLPGHRSYVLISVAYRLVEFDLCAFSGSSAYLSAIKRSKILILSIRPSSLEKITVWSVLPVLPVCQSVPSNHPKTQEPHFCGEPLINNSSRVSIVMKLPKVLTVSGPIAVCAAYYLNNNNQLSDGPHITPATVHAAERNLQLQQVLIALFPLPELLSPKWTNRVVNVGSFLFAFAMNE